MMRWRITIGSLGVALALYGALRILQDRRLTNPFGIAQWLAGAIVLHDFVLTPVVLAIGWAVSRLPARVRGHVQAMLMIDGLVAVVALVLIARQGSRPEALALLTTDYARSLLVILAGVGAVTAAHYVLGAVRRSRRNDRDAADQDSTVESPASSA